jgi:hypothetical protein
MAVEGPLGLSEKALQATPLQRLQRLQRRLTKRPITPDREVVRTLGRSNCRWFPAVISLEPGEMRQAPGSDGASPYRSMTPPRCLQANGRVQATQQIEPRTNHRGASRHSVQPTRGVDSVVKRGSMPVILCSCGFCLTSLRLSLALNNNLGARSRAAELRDR